MNLFSGPLRGTGPLPDTTRAPYWSFGYSDLGDTALLAEEAVSCEPVSTRDSVVSGKITGNLLNFGADPVSDSKVVPMYRVPLAKFPMKRNSVFLSPIRVRKVR